MAASFAASADARPAPTPAFDGDTDALVLAAKSGDRDAFGALAERYFAAIYNFAYRTMGDSDEAADVAQDTMLKAWLAIGRTDDQLHVGGWLYRIATNCCLDRLRRRRRLRWIPWDADKHDHLRASRDWLPEASAVRDETAGEIRAALDRVGRRHRVGLLLREEDDLSCEEIGDLLGIGRSASKSMLHRARAELRGVAIDMGMAREAMTA